MVGSMTDRGHQFLTDWGKVKPNPRSYRSESPSCVCGDSRSEKYEERGTANLEIHAQFGTTMESGGIRGNITLLILIHIMIPTIQT